MPAEGARRVVIVDYQLSNLFSVRRACEVVGLTASLSCDPAEVLEADALILPGVGAFGEAMDRLRGLGLLPALLEAARRETPIFGICLGLQLLFSESEEFGSTPGLDLVKGVIRRFPEAASGGRRVKVPHVGWNRIRPGEGRSWRGSPLESTAEGAFMYFVHSFYALPEDPADVLATTDYAGLTYCSSVSRGAGIFATQFHPEKSGPKGLNIYRTWAARHRLIPQLG